MTFVILKMTFVILKMTFVILSCEVDVWVYHDGQPDGWQRLSRCYPTVDDVS